MKILGMTYLGLGALMITMVVFLKLLVEYGPVAGFSFFAFVLFIVGIILIKLDKQNTDS